MHRVQGRIAYGAGFFHEGFSPMRLPCQRGIQRLICLFGGHRDLTPEAAYARVIGGVVVEELHYCGACGGPSWVRQPDGRQRTLKWSEAGLTE